MLAALSPEDLSVFMASGGSAEALSQMHITPRSPVDRDALYCVLQLLRQLDSRPHLRHFDFSLAGTALGAEAARAGAQGPLPGLLIPDFHAWLCQSLAEEGKGTPPPVRPLILQAPGDKSAMSSFLEQDSKAGGGRGGGAGSAAAALDLDLFAAPAVAPAVQEAPQPQQPQPQQPQAPIAVSGYSDLASLASAGDI
jgi:hypothetical protein